MISQFIRNKQKTIKKPVKIEGLGLFTGLNVSLRLLPAPEDHGICFKRMDLPNQPIIPAHVSSAKETSRYTLIKKDKASVQTVEHILSALSAFQVDNLLIEISGPEVLVGDGSSQIFVNLIEKAGLQEQNAPRKLIRLKQPISWSDGDVHIIALPSDEYRISYTLHYPHSSFIKSQYYHFVVDQKFYKTDIAPCRTFSLFEEIEPMLKNGLIKGGGLDNALIIKDDIVLNPEGVRFPDEMVRHKVLDLIGDLSLIGIPFLSHIIAIRSGHFSNVSFAKKLLKCFEENQ